MSAKLESSTKLKAGDVVRYEGDATGRDMTKPMLGSIGVVVESHPYGYVQPKGMVGVNWIVRMGNYPTTYFWYEKNLRKIVEAEP